MTSSYDLPLQGQRSKKVKIWNYFKWQKKTEWLVGHEETCKTVHGDLIIRPNIKGSKVMSKSLCQAIGQMHVLTCEHNVHKFFFFFLATLWFAVALTYFSQFWPNLLRIVIGHSHLCHISLTFIWPLTLTLWTKWMCFSLKTFQLFQITLDFYVTHIYVVP